MKISAVSQNFKGFSNPLSNSVTMPNGNIHTLSVQLDNIGTEDLNQYREYKRMLGFPKEEIYGDVLTMTYANTYDNEHFFVNDKPILTGIDMARLNAYEFASKEAKAEYKKEEKLLIKLYTFLAKVTRTLMNEKTLETDDESMSQVRKEAFYNLSESLNNNKVAMTIIQDARLYPKPFQQNSQRINRFIEKSMSVLLG
jgi:hypothetical protein